jgi:RNA polymerase sigma factor (TIGR02999 family)
LIDYARIRNAEKRGGAEKTQIALNEAVNYESASNFDVVKVDEALKRLEELDKRQAQIVEMKFFGGLKIEEIAEVLSISPSTVKREWSTAKMFLSRFLKD